ncbi:glycine receptor subunit alpha-1-like, partial [Amphibalanus amphitrite]|uniref:glycine receptor subunit alpha-1-like n=1 Tax=Amphibalanus amphitrite TaxID=1232801 RepID=UPI001C9180C5
NYSCLEAKFLLDRNFGYHLVQSYIPSSLIVVISWVSFWLDVDAIPSRVTLGVTTLLTICSESSGNTDKMPPVSYMKALDIWMSVCTAFIFTALLEFTLVNQLSRPRRQMVCWVMHVTKGVPERQLYMPDLCEDWCIVRQQLKKKRDDMPSLTMQLVDSGSAGGGPELAVPELAGRRCYCQRRMSAAGWIDRVSRLGFPLAFCAFGAFYWTHYNK